MTATDIQQIIDKYGRAVFDAALRQVYINLAWDIVWLVALGFLALTLWRLNPRYKTWRDGLDSFEQDMATAGGVALTRVAPVILGGLMLLIGGDVVTNLFNPTWAALQIILGAVPHG